jgi:integrase
MKSAEALISATLPLNIIRSYPRKSPGCRVRNMAGEMAMARRLGRLKAGEITRLGPGRHHDGGGLYLVVGQGAARSWVFRFRRDGKLHDYGLGPVHTVSLADARKKAHGCRSALFEGETPVRQRQAKRLERVRAAAKAVTFEQAAEQYIKAHAAGWRDPKAERQWRQSLTDYAYPVLGKEPVGKIDTALVMRVLKPIWETKTETAGRVRSRIENILDAWAATRPLEPDEDRQRDNPARWRGHIEHLLPAPRKVRKVEHHPALPYAEIGDFMAKLRQQEGVAARALEFAILTAGRTDEVLGATWDEIGEIAERTWTLPAGRHKAGKTTGKEHRVPLSDGAVAIIEAMAALRVDKHVFPGRGSKGALGPQAMRRVLAGLGRADIDVHGFRSTFRDWAGETTAHPRDVIEQALAHTLKDRSEAAYRRGDLFDKRRALMRDWDIRCAGGAVVVPIRREA